MKPNWKDAPEWANYLAMDSNGAWWWYRNEPKQRDYIWSSEYQRHYAGSSKADGNKKFKNWNHTLEQRPTK